MKAVLFERIGGPEVLKIGEVATPVPAQDEVLVKTAFAGINFADIGRRTGLYGSVKLPFVAGLEGSGTVEAVGPGVTHVRPGAKVLAYQLQGSYAEYFIAKKEKVFAVPATMSMEDAAGIPQIFMTSWNALVHKAKLQRGESILIQSAGNGAGIAAVQIAKHLGAIRIIGTASNAEKLKAAKGAGATDLINYTEVDFAAEVTKITQGKGVDVVLDGVGGETFTKGVKCLAPNGRILSLGFSGGDSTLSFHAFDLGRGIVIMGGAAGFGNLPRSEFEKVLTLFKEGEFKPTPTTVFPWTEAGAAQKFLEDRKAVGKVLLKVS